MLDKHEWRAGTKPALADRIGIMYDGDYLVGGTVCNEEILRLADENRALREERASNYQAGLAAGRAAMADENTALREQFSRQGQDLAVLKASIATWKRETLANIRRELRAWAAAERSSSLPLSGASILDAMLQLVDRVLPEGKEG